MAEIAFSLLCHKDPAAVIQQAALVYIHKNNVRMHHAM